MSPSGALLLSSYRAIFTFGPAALPISARCVTTMSVEIVICDPAHTSGPPVLPPLKTLSHP